MEEAPKQYTWSEMKLLSEIEALKDEIAKPKFGGSHTEERLAGLKDRLVKVQADLDSLYEQRRTQK